MSEDTSTGPEYSDGSKLTGNFPLREEINEWKDRLRIAADAFVTNHTDSEVRRMYGHHFRSFRDGAIWEHERLESLLSSITAERDNLLDVKRRLLENDRLQLEIIDTIQKERDELKRWKDSLELELAEHIMEQNKRKKI